MSIPVLDSVIITDDDINEIEALLGNVVFDEPRRQVIKTLNSTDIQAFPGSGKTTVLIAKLAILAKKWPYTNKGICVLSHTNVARSEIEERLGKTEIGKQLLSYPHFIGTVHSFFDKFVGLPWLRSNGYPITLIDTEIVLARRYRSLQYGTKTYFERQGKTLSVCESIDFPILIDIGCRDTSPSYINVRKCVEKSFREGYFTFNEILNVSKFALDQCEFLSKAIQTRFPLLFIDEAQDTSEIQWELIDKSFSDSTLSIKQAFGDANQAIFQSYSNSSTNNAFSADGYLSLPDSHRFGKSIAHLVDTLGVSRRGLIGKLQAFEENSNKHTIFLYDKNNIEAVLPAYAEHLLTCFSDQEIATNDRLGCYVVGMVHNTDPTAKTDARFPIGIRDYWADYDPNATKTTFKPNYFIEYFRLGLQALKLDNDYSNFVEYLSEALRRIVRNKTDNIISSTGKAFNSLMAIIPDEKKKKFRADLLALIRLPCKNEAEWIVVALRVKEILEQYFEISDVNPQLFKWIENGVIGYEATTRSSSNKNIYVYTSPKSGRSVCIHLASIHSVKGKTHLATLAVDTYWYDPNIKNILPWLCGLPPKKKIGKRDSMRLKCHYVALTRARGLICIAMSKDSVSEDQIKLLCTNGWNVVVL